MKKIAFVCLLPMITFASMVRAGEGAKAAVQAAAPFMDDLTFAMVRLDLQRIDLSAVRERLQGLGMPKKELAGVFGVIESWRRSFLEAQGKEVIVLLNWADPLDAVVVLIPPQQKSDRFALVQAMEKLPGFKAQEAGGVILGSNYPSLLRKRQGQAPPELLAALAAVDGTVLQVVVVPPPPLRRAFEEMVPRFPKELGSGSTAPLTRGIKWLAAGLELDKKLSVRLVLQASDAAAAQEVLKLVGLMYQAAGQLREMKELLPDFAKLAPMLTPKVEGDRLTLAVGDKEMSQVLFPLAAKVQVNAKRAQSSNNLKQIALAMHGYHDVKKSFPPSASYGKGKALLSWRVHLLPFLDQAALYQEFKLDEPWDSPHNKKLIAKMPAVFRSPFQTRPEDGKTMYLVPIGPSTIFPGTKGISVRDITDGTSNTILVVEASEAQAVYWTQPQDFRVDPKDPARGLFVPVLNGTNVAFADGSVRFVSHAVTAEGLYAMFTRNGGDVIPE